MMRNSILYAGLCLWGAASPVWAKLPQQATSGVQVLDFSQSGAVSAAQAPPTPLDRVRAAMVASFTGGAERGQSATALSDPGAYQVVFAEGRQSQATSFILSPVIAVPAWMRRGRQSLAMHMLPTTIPSIGACGARDYLPSGLLKAVGEERRRLLYPLVTQTACRFGIPVGLFDAMIVQESRYNAFAQSPKGAFGLGQLMPGTALQLGVNRYDLRGNLDGAARYLSAHLREFRDPSLALAAYNAGPMRVRRSGGIPRIYETQDYVRSILWNWRMLEAR
jgi:Transglycosylase SLT domain